MVCGGGGGVGWGGVGWGGGWGGRGGVGGGWWVVWGGVCGVGGGGGGLGVGGGLRGQINPIGCFVLNNTAFLVKRRRAKGLESQSSPCD